MSERDALAAIVLDALNETAFEDDDPEPNRNLALDIADAIVASGWPAVVPAWTKLAEWHEDRPAAHQTRR